jgi:cytochrome c6
MAIMCLIMVLSVAVVSAVGSTTLIAEQSRGEAEFREYCAECHVDGGNIIKSTKTLSEKDRVTNGIKTADDIIKIIRNPGEGMTRFDDKTLPNNEARRIAEFIIKTFK